MIIASFESFGGFAEHKGDLLALKKKIDVHDVTPMGCKTAMSLSSGWSDRLIASV
jgi:hypothetical protein